MTPKRALHSLQVLLIASLIITPVWLSLANSARAETPAGYSEYYIPGSEEQMWGIFYDLDPYLLDINQGMHSTVAITAGTDNTSLYYDHWEDGYDFVPGDPASADESYILNQGDVQVFESANIPVNPRGTDTYHDGQDRIYSVGGAVTVSRATWTESASTLFAQAWEVLPTRPYQTQYSIPAGENLAAAPTNYTDFTSSYMILQSTADDNSVQVDDPLTALSPDIDAILDKGEVTQLYHVNAGTTVNATYPVQVQTIYGNDYGGTAHYDSRDFTLIPSALWDTEYYSPVGGFGGGYETDLYIYNPHSTDLTISYQDMLGQGSFSIPAGGTVAYSSGTGRYVPQDSGVYLSAGQPFWGIGSADTESTTYDWGFSLLPASALTSDYYLGWAPGTSEPVPTDNGSPAFVTPVQDNTTIYADFSPVDGSADVSYTSIPSPKNRLK